MKRITDPKELVVGDAYWLRSKTFPESAPIASTLRKDFDEPYFEKCIWASERNPQALQKWDIIGPIPKPEEWRS